MTDKNVHGSDDPAIGTKAWCIAFMINFNAYFFI
jgi:hypothetical protein